MAEAKSIPADIFEEMAGMREITPPKSAASEENVKSETIVTPLDEGRLFKASVAFVSKVQKKLVKGFYKVAKRIVELQKGNPYSPSTIRKNIKYAVMDKELYELLQDEGNRQVLIKSLTDSLDK